MVTVQPTDALLVIDMQLDFNASDIPPMVTWGTSPQDALPITEVIPDPANAPDENKREAWTRSLASNFSQAWTKSAFFISCRPS